MACRSVTQPQLLDGKIAGTLPLTDEELYAGLGPERAEHDEREAPAAAMSHDAETALHA